MLATPILLAFSMAPPGLAETPKLTDDEIKKILIDKSVADYDGPCPCPESLDANNHKCGERSARTRPGGMTILCSDSDVTAAMIYDYRKKNDRRSELFRLILGGGMSIGFGDHLDFREHAGSEGKRHLVLESSKYQPSALAGVAVKLKGPVDVFTSLNVADGNKLLRDGLVMGIDLRIRGGFGLAFGYQVRSKDGLRHALVQAVENDENLKMKPTERKDFDGLELIADYPSPPLIEGFNHSVFVGVVFPVRFSTIFNTKD